MASMSPLRRAISAALLLSPFTAKRAGQNMTTPTVVATVSLVRAASWTPAASAALAEILSAFPRLIASEWRGS